MSWQHGRQGENCGLHPLIHTRLKFPLAQDLVICQCKEKAPNDQFNSKSNEGLIQVLKEKQERIKKRKAIAEAQRRKEKQVKGGGRQ